MWSRRCNLSVTARGGKAEFREPRLVIAMNEVVRDAGMVRFDSEEFFQDRGGLLAVGEGFVVVRFGGEQGERVENRRFVIVRIGLVNLLHRVGVRLGANRMVKLFRIAVEG